MELFNNRLHKFLEVKIKKEKGSHGYKSFS